MRRIVTATLFVICLVAICLILLGTVASSVLLLPATQDVGLFAFGAVAIAAALLVFRRAEDVRPHSFSWLRFFICTFASMRNVNIAFAVSIGGHFQINRRRYGTNTETARNGVGLQHVVASAFGNIAPNFALKPP